MSANCEDPNASLNGGPDLKYNLSTRVVYGFFFNFIFNTVFVRTAKVL